MDNPLNIIQLTKGIKQCDEIVFTEFYNLYSDRIYQFLIVLYPWDVELVNDCFQEVQIRIIKYIKIFHEEKEFWNWIKCLSRTTLIDELRKRKKLKNFESLDQFEEDMIEKTFNSQNDALHEQLNKAINELSLEDRKLLIDVYSKKLSHADISTEYGKTKKAIESKVFRLRKQLKERILSGLSDGR